MFRNCGGMFLLLAGLTGCAAQRHQLHDQNHDHQVGAAPTTAGLTASASAVEAQPEVMRTPLTSTQAIPVAYEVPVDLPDATTEAKADTESDAGVVHSDVFMKFKTATVTNPIEDRGQPDAVGLTLDQVINTCLIADPLIRAGFEAINQASADALSASLKPNPQIFTDIQLLPLTRPFIVTRQGGPPQYDAIVSYPIDWYLFGKQAAAMVSAELGVRVSEAEYAELIRQRVLQASLAYYDVLEAVALRNLARQDVENLLRVEAVTGKAVENGGRPPVELNRIRLDRLKSEQTLRSADAAVVSARAKLWALLGRTGTDPSFAVAGSLDNPLDIEPLPSDEAFALAEQNRPDLQALRWRLSQAQAVTVLEERKAYPEIAPSLGYTRQFQAKAIGFPDANSYSAAISMSLPLFNRNQGNRAKAASLVVQSQYGLQAGLVQLRSEIEQVVQEFRTARDNAQAVADEQIKLAEQVRDSMNMAYEAGGRPLLDLLDAQRNYRETYRLYIGSRANYRRASVKFNAALGTQAMP